MSTATFIGATGAAWFAGAPASATTFNTVQFSSSGGTDVIWNFALPAHAKDVEYFYVLSNSAVAATAGDFGNLVYSDLQVGDANPHGGGQAFLQTGDLGSGPASQDLFFRVQSTIPVPEPSTAALSLFGLALPTRRRRR